MIMFFPVVGVREIIHDRFILVNADHTPDYDGHDYSCQVTLQTD